jgi:NADH dehydrogenase/NADH:ubiquinone oxidoreductase subunit G
VNTEFFSEEKKQKFLLTLIKLYQRFFGNVIDVCPVGALTDRTSVFLAEFGLQNQ